MRHFSDVKIQSLAYTFVVSHIGYESLHSLFIGEESLLCLSQIILLGSYQVACLMP